MIKTTPKRIAFIGNGAIGHRVFHTIKYELSPRSEFAFLVRNNEKNITTQDNLSIFSKAQDLLDWRPDLVIECAGHDAVQLLVPTLLRSGIDVVIVSVGALGDAKLRSTLESAAETGAARMIVVSGAIGGLDALQSSRMAELTSVKYIGRKPPVAWSGTPASEKINLNAVKEPLIIFEGSASEAAMLYPKNANVTAAVALAGVGFDDTQVILIADPSVIKNVHELQVVGEFGSFTIHLENNPLPSNPKTSWLAALSIEATLKKHLNPQLI